MAEGGCRTPLGVVWKPGTLFIPTTLRNSWTNGAKDDSLLGHYLDAQESEHGKARYPDTVPSSRLARPRKAEAQSGRVMWEATISGATKMALLSCSVAEARSPE